MAIIYFNTHDGSVLTDKTDAGEDAIRNGRAIKINAPDNILHWRLKANLSTSEVIVYGGTGKTEAQALQQKADEGTAEAIAKKEIADLKMALIEKQEEERKALQATFNNSGGL